MKKNQETKKFNPDLSGFARIEFGTFEHRTVGAEVDLVVNGAVVETLPLFFNGWVNATYNEVMDEYQTKLNILFDIVKTTTPKSSSRNRERAWIKGKFFNSSTEFKNFVDELGAVIETEYNKMFSKKMKSELL
jgi:hypothetical protein